MKVIDKFLISLLILCAQSTAGSAQGPALKIGDSVPEELLQIVGNHSLDRKPSIINFWATWCVPCIRELKILDSVLRESDGIHILSVNYESASKIDSFLQNHDDLRSGKLNFFPADTVFRRYFPHQVLPHNIWVDADGVIKHITGGEAMKSENIFAFMENRKMNVKDKVNPIVFDPFEPFHLSDSAFVYRSILTKRIAGIFSGKTFHPIGHGEQRKIIRAFTYNTILHNMLWLAVSKGRSPANFFNTMRIETADSLRFFTPSQAPASFARSKYASRDEWREDHTHCYELRFPKPIKDSLFFSNMLEDLQRNFDIAVEKVEDSIMCSVITSNTPTKSLVSPGDSTFIDLDDHRLIVQNVDVLYLLEYLNERVKEKPSDVPVDPPFVDKTGGLKINLQVDFPDGMPKYEELRKIVQDRCQIGIEHRLEKYAITIIKDMS